MREILFRGKTGKTWRYGDAHTDYHGKISTIIVPSICWETKTIETQCAGYFGVDPETVGQYTGLTDKNGKKIFEGDIVKVKTEYIDETIYLVAYRDCGFKLIYRPSNGVVNLTNNKSRNIEVIGNIYDNPEL